MTHILVVDDHPSCAALVATTLREEGYETSEITAYEDGARTLRSRSWDLLITDLSLDGGHTGLELLLDARAVAPQNPIIVITGHADMDNAVEIVRSGAIDCIAKPVEQERLLEAVRRALPEAATTVAAHRLAGGSQAIVDVYRAIARAAACDDPVLIWGPEGCGKQLAAREIHRLGRRSSAPCRVLDCTGWALRDAQRELDLALEAPAGSLVLRRIGSMSMSAQSLLAEMAEPIAARGVRLLATARRAEPTPAPELVRALGITSIEVPSLVDHSADAPSIAAEILRRLRRRLGRTVRLTDAAAESLARRPWTGDVRELAGVVETAALRTAGDALDLPEIDGVMRERGSAGAEARGAVSFCAGCGRTVADGSPDACTHGADPAAECAPPRFRGSRYLPYRLLARHEATDVWAAWQPAVARRVVVKVLNGATPDDVARFRREWRVQAGLRHPRIPALLEAGTDEENPNRLYMVMEMVEGLPFDVHSRRVQELEGPATALSSIVRLGAEAAAILGYLHRRGLVHRDVKPQNLLVAEGGIHLIDYGLARTTNRDDGMTSVGVVEGTIPFMSPEQTRGLPDLIDARSDVWSLGASLYFLACGRLPFGAGEFSEVAARICGSDPAPPRELNPLVSPALQAALLRALDRDPARRFEDGCALQAALAGEGVSP